MSHDVYFYQKSQESPTKKGFLSGLVGSRENVQSTLDRNELQSFLTSLGCFSEIKNTDSGFNAVYHNKDTEATAYFTFNRDDRARNHDHQGFSYTGLSLNINYYRPFYYAYEAALVSETISKKFNLYISDPQSRDSAPKMRTADEMFATWDRINTESICQMIERMRKEGKENEETTPNIWSRMSRDTSRSYWQYLYNHDKIAKYVEDKNISACVPTWIFVFQRNSDKKLMTCIPFLEGVNYVLPNCDLFDVSWADRSKSGIVKSEILTNKIHGILRPLGMPGVDLQYMDNESPEKIREIVHSINLDDQFNDNYKIVRQKNSFVPGVFIDID